MFQPMTNHIQANVLAMQGIGLASAYSWDSCPGAGLACAYLEEVMIHPGSRGDPDTRPGVAQIMTLDL